MSSALDRVSSELEATVGRFAALVRRVGLKHRLPEADLEDVLQEVRIRLWRARSRPRCGVAGWAARLPWAGALAVGVGSGYGSVFGCCRCALISMRGVWLQ